MQQGLQCSRVCNAAGVAMQQGLQCSMGCNAAGVTILAKYKINTQSPLELSIAPLRE